MFRCLRLSAIYPLKYCLPRPSPAQLLPVANSVSLQLRNAHVPPIMSAPNKTFHKGPKRQKRDKPKRKEKVHELDEVLQNDIDKLLKKNKPDADAESADDAPTPPQPTLPEPFTEIEVRIAELSSTGDGLALSENGDHVYVVPFTVPGDKALVKVVRHVKPLSYSVTDFLKVIEPGPLRKDDAIGCKYFGKCSGCQLQMMSYEDQLAHKKRIVEKAYANFSGLIPELIPAIEDTFPSPKQYGYRTKLTPHFPAPAGRGVTPGEFLETPPIGFTFKNQRRHLDIEDCPLGTDIIREGLKSERKRVAENLTKYKRGATILLRETTTRTPKETSSTDADAKTVITYENPNKPHQESGDQITTEHPSYTETKRCVTDQNATSVEYIDDYLFTNKAGAFFQNNNSILSGFTEYIRQHALSNPSITPNADSSNPATTPIKYLLDAYSGSGLFTITLSPLFKSSLGVDVAGDSIVSARENARANHLPNTGFAAADAAVLFADVPYPADQTLLVIDPPRKGCSDDFLRQMLEYGPRRVVYVSCNVHTQARDVAVMVQGDGKTGVRYEIESIRGFDFFPQTGHVEGVAVLNKVV